MKSEIRQKLIDRFPEELRSLVKGLSALDLYGLVARYRDQDLLNEIVRKAGDVELVREVARAANPARYRSRSAKILHDQRVDQAVISTEVAQECIVGLFGAVHAMRGQISRKSWLEDVRYHLGQLDVLFSHIQEEIYEYEESRKIIYGDNGLPSTPIR